MAAHTMASPAAHHTNGATMSAGSPAYPDDGDVDQSLAELASIHEQLAALRSGTQPALQPSHTPPAVAAATSSTGPISDAMRQVREAVRFGPGWTAAVRRGQLSSLQSASVHTSASSESALLSRHIETTNGSSGSISAASPDVATPLGSHMPSPSTLLHRLSVAFAIYGPGLGAQSSDVAVDDTTLPPAHEAAALMGSSTDHSRDSPHGHSQQPITSPPPLPGHSLHGSGTPVSGASSVVPSAVFTPPPRDQSSSEEGHVGRGFPTLLPHHSRSSIASSPSHGSSTHTILHHMTPAPRHRHTPTASTASPKATRSLGAAAPRRNRPGRDSPANGSHSFGSSAGAVAGSSGSDLGAGHSGDPSTPRERVSPLRTSGKGSRASVSPDEDAGTLSPASKAAIRGTKVTRGARDASSQPASGDDESAPRMTLLYPQSSHDTPAARAKREHRFATSFRPAQDTRDAAVPADGIMALEHAVERRKLSKQQKVRQGLERLNRFHRQYVKRAQARAAHRTGGATAMADSGTAHGFEHTGGSGTSRDASMPHLRGHSGDLDDSLRYMQILTPHDDYVTHASLNHAFDDGDDTPRSGSQLGFDDGGITPTSRGGSTPLHHGDSNEFGEFRASGGGIASPVAFDSRDVATAKPRSRRHTTRRVVAKLRRAVRRTGQKRGGQLAGPGSGDAGGRVVAAGTVPGNIHRDHGQHSKHDAEAGMPTGKFHKLTVDVDMEPHNHRPLRSNASTTSAVSTGGAIDTTPGARDGLISARSSGNLSLAAAFGDTTGLDTSTTPTAGVRSAAQHAVPPAGSNAALQGHGAGMRSVVHPRPAGAPTRDAGLGSGGDNRAAVTRGFGDGAAVSARRRMQGGAPRGSELHILQPRSLRGVNEDGVGPMGTPPPGVEGDEPLSLSSILADSMGGVVSLGAVRKRAGVGGSNGGVGGAGAAAQAMSPRRHHRHSTGSSSRSLATRHRRHKHRESAGSAPAIVAHP